MEVVNPTPMGGGARSVTAFFDASSVHRLGMQSPSCSPWGSPDFAGGGRRSTNAKLGSFIGDNAADAGASTSDNAFRNLAIDHRAGRSPDVPPSPPSAPMPPTTSFTLPPLLVKVSNSPPRLNKEKTVA